LSNTLMMGLPVVSMRSEIFCRKQSPWTKTSVGPVPDAVVRRRRRWPRLGRKNTTASTGHTAPPPPPPSTHVTPATPPCRGVMPAVEEADFIQHSEHFGRESARLSPAARSRPPSAPRLAPLVTTPHVALGQKARQPQVQRSGARR
jgi:hypothetical protein